MEENCGGIAASVQDTLGGKARMALIVCCSPAVSDAAETISSLRFGARAKGIVINLQVSNASSCPSSDIKPHTAHQLGQLLLRALLLKPCWSCRSPLSGRLHIVRQTSS